LIESRQSYCNENRVQFFWPTQYDRAMRPIMYGAVGALKIFGSPWLRQRLPFRNC